MPRTINLSHLVALVRIGDDGEIRTKIYVSRSANKQRQRVADAFQATCPRYGIESRIAVFFPRKLMLRLHGVWKTFLKFSIFDKDAASCLHLFLNLSIYS